MSDDFTDSLRYRAGQSNDGNLATIALNAAARIDRLEEELATMKRRAQTYEAANEKLIAERNNAHNETLEKAAVFFTERAPVYWYNDAARLIRTLKI